MATKKITADTVVDAVTTGAAVVADAVATATEAAVEATKKTTKKAAAKKATKAAEGEAAPKKTTTRRKKTVVSFQVELDGLTLALEEIQAAVEKAVEEKGLKAAELKVYLNTTEKAAYYTVDGEGSAEYRVDLTTL